MFNPPPFNPNLPCELIAENTFEALRIARQGEWVYKFLRPHDSFAGQTAEERRRQILLRVRESHRRAELNPLAYDDTTNCLISRHVRGPFASTKACQALRQKMIEEAIPTLADVCPQNVVMTDRGPLIIDFAIDTARTELLQSPTLRQD